EPAEVELTHCVGGHALLSERAQTTLQACVDLLLHEGLGNRELELRDELVEHLVAGLRLQRVLLALCYALAKLGFEVAPTLVVAELLGELIVALGIGLLLDRLYGDVVADGLAREARVAELGGVT